MILERNIYRFLILGLVLYIMYYRGCVVKPCPQVQSPVNTVRVDTFYKLVHDVLTYTPKPKVVIKYDSIYVIEPQIPDNKVPTPYYFDKGIDGTYYADTVTVEFGKLIIADTIKDNLITFRSVTTDFKIPATHEVRTIQPRLRNQLYIGIGAIGNAKTIIHGVEGMFTLKTKKDQMYELGAVYLGSELYYKAGLKFKLSFK